MATIHLSTLDDTLKKIVERCYPEYTGRKYKITTVPNDYSYAIRNYWDGGTKHYIVVMNLETGFIAVPKADSENPMNGMAHSQTKIPANHIFVEHCIFCGKDLGITIYVREDNAAKFLPKQTDQELPLLEKLVIWYTCRLKNTYAGKSEIRYQEAKRYHKDIEFSFNDWCKARENLAMRGLLKNGNFGITPEGRNMEQTLNKQDMEGKYSHV